MTTQTKRLYRRFDATATEQECRKCGKTKPMSAFYAEPYTRADGVRPRKSTCKRCTIKNVMERQGQAPSKPRSNPVDLPMDEKIAAYRERQARARFAEQKRQKEAEARAAMRPANLWVNPNLESVQ